MKILSILNNTELDEFKKEAKKRYSEEDYKIFEESIKEIADYNDWDFNFVPLSGFAGAIVFEYKAVNLNKKQYIIQLCHTNYVDDEYSILFIVDEKPEKSNIENLLDSKKYYKDMEI